MTAPSPAGAPSDNSRRCPGGCQLRIALDLFVCPTCWVRLPYEYQQPIQAAYQRDQDAYRQAVITACRWYVDNPGGAS